MYRHFLTSLVIVRVMEKSDALTLKFIISQQYTLLPDQLWKTLIRVQHLPGIILTLIFCLVQILCTIHLAYATRMNLKLQKKSSRETSQWEKEKSKILKKFFGTNKLKKLNPAERSQQCHTFSLQTLVVI